MNPEEPNFNFEPPLQKQSKLVKSEKEIVWEQKSEEVKQITNRLGKGVDEKIKESVTAFLIHEFTTINSCEGHVVAADKKHGLLIYPWIEVDAHKLEWWEEGEEKKRDWTIQNLKQQTKMISFLEEFYRERKTPLDVRLTLDNLSTYGNFRVQSFGAKIWPILTPEECKQKLELYQKEMSDFTKFLKDKHFSKE